MVRTRTKKLRGGHYGRGMKAGRGKGKKGGNGMAGLGKHRWIWMVKYDPLHYGGKGFTSHHYAKPPVAISLSELETLYPSLQKKGYVESGEIPVINLKNAGIDKLLGSGELNLKVKVIVSKATEKALSKLSASGSTVETDG
ncbi:MAG: uL15m family ribosomal protein [Thermoplasmataceae archaeon]|jgi:large subunit ribosomal protein L15|nr:uL15 family ribosomal protein [Candidatus Thermoplasmatota archaeon]